MTKEKTEVNNGYIYIVEKNVPSQSYEYSIETGVKLPVRSKKPRQHRGSKYPFAAMKAGDSFFVPATNGKLFKAHPYFKLYPGMKFKTRTMLNAEGVNGTRVWRVK